MSVDTHLKGKNLAPYRTAHSQDVKVLVSQALAGYPGEMVLDVRGKLLKKWLLEVDRGDSCDL